MGDPWTTYLLRYGEIGIKSRSVRKRFEHQLVENLEAHFHRAGKTCIIDRQWGRIFLDSPDEAIARHTIAHTFGLVSGSPTTVLDSDLEGICQHIEGVAPDHVAPEKSFAIRARRTGQHAYTSQDIGIEGGGAVLRAVPEATVDLDEPDVEISVEVRNDKAYVFTETIDGPGGLPTGSQGTIVVPMLGPRSPAAAWLVMRRGATAHLLCPAGCREVAETLVPWAPGGKLTLIEETPTREAMLAAAEALAEQIGAEAIALDDHEARVVAGAGLDVPVLYPLAGLPGKRWPEGAYRASKQAAEVHPKPCVGEEGADATTVQGALSDLEPETF